MAGIGTVLLAARRAVGVGLCVVGLSQAATLLRYPYLQNLRADRVTILWTTAENGEGLVLYSADRNTWSSTFATSRRFGTTETALPSAYFQHQVDITGLSPGTSYFYRILVDDQELASGDDLRFRTADSGPFNFLVFGDSGEGTQGQKDLAQLMLTEMAKPRPPSFLVHVGDIAYEDGTYDQFERNYFPYYRDLMKRIAFFTTPGNHEYVTNSAAPYLALHAPPTETVPVQDRGRYYSFDWGNVHFISLDSNAPLNDAANGNGQMLQWLEADLQRTRQTWKVVFFHHTPFPILQHEGDSLSTLGRTRIAPLMEKYFVDLVLSGHEHNFQETKPIRGARPGEPSFSFRPGEPGFAFVDPGFGTVYIHSGGGGGPLHPVVPRPFQAYAESAFHYIRAEVQGARMVLHVIRVDGIEIDTVPLDPRLVPTGQAPQLSAGGVVNAASYTPGIARGGLVSIYGRNLAVREGTPPPAPQGAPPAPLPTLLAGTSVTLNGQRIPLLFASSLQINAQLPFDLTGTATLRVTTIDGFSEGTVAIAEAAPAIFTASPEPAVVHLNGTLVNTSAPARGGETLSLYMTGLGDVDGSISAGQPAPTPPPLLSVRASVQVQLAGRTIQPSFAGLAPGYAGLYQVNFQVPPGTTGGSQPLRILTRDVSSNEVRLAIQ